MRKILDQSFFNRDTFLVAEELLGKFLVRKIGSREIACMITETEAYDGPWDLASHASKGVTARTKVMYGSPGHWYVYLCYGIHYLLNIVTREEGYPAAILIRAIVTMDQVSLNGPGKLTKFLKINKSLNAKVASPKDGLWFEERGITPTKFTIEKLPRVGVDYAGPIWSAKKFRFKMRL